MMTINRKVRKIPAWPVLLILCLGMFILTACGAGEGKSLVLFEGENYNYTLVYGSQREDWENSAIVEIYEALTKECGTEPELLSYTELEDSKSTKQILIGSTNRSESALPELDADDCYWCVKVDGNKIIVNGSNEYMLGLAVDFFMENWSDGEAEGQVVVAGVENEVTLADYYREGWLLETIPAYPGDNDLATVLYNDGTYLKQYGNQRAAASQMQSVTATDAEDLADYVAALKTNKYTEESHTTIEKNEFYRFTKDDQRIYVNYYGNEGRALVVLDEAKGVSVAETSYTYEPKAGEQTEIYMFGLKMDPNGVNISTNTSGYVNNGENIIIKCADNSVIIIDGGDDEQMSPADQERFFNLLHKITGTGENEKIRVSAWCISHFHSDHVSGLKAVMAANASKFNIERVICNMPDPTTVGEKSDLLFAETTGAILGSFPNCQDIKVHTGDVIQLADVTLTVTFTHEDLTDSKGTFTSTDFNDTSTVYKVETACGMSMLLGGDMNVSAEAVMCKNFTTATLKSDILQQPHHNFNNNTTIYEYANAQVMLFTQSRGGLVRDEDMTKRSTLAKKWCSEWYCEGSETVGFAYENGKVKLIYHAEDIY